MELVRAHSSRKHGEARESPEARRRRARAAAVARVRGGSRCGAPTEADMVAIEALEHCEDVRQGVGLDCATGGRLHGSRRRGAPALMAKHGTGQEGGRVVDGVKQKLTTVAVEAVVWSEELCGRSNRRRRLAGPASSR
jgi:hypothetical protein